MLENNYLITLTAGIVLENNYPISLTAGIVLQNNCPMSFTAALLLFRRCINIMGEFDDGSYNNSKMSGFMLTTLTHLPQATLPPLCFSGWPTVCGDVVSEEGL